MSASKEDLKLNLVGKYKICEEHLKLTHQSEMNKKLLAKAKYDIILENKEGKIRSIKTKIDSLKGKAK